MVRPMMRVAVLSHCAWFVVCSGGGIALAPGARVASTNVGATWQNRNDYCNANGLTRCVGCVGGTDCEYTLPGGYGYSVWYSFRSSTARRR